MAKDNIHSPSPQLLCDFVGGKVGHRFRFDAGRGQGLPKAVGLKGNTPLHVVDATPGLGRDAFLLASLGATVTMVERSAHMHKLLAEGMARAKDASPEHAAVIARMTLIHGDSKDLIADLRPEVIMVDPMHPPRGKSALVKEEMRLLRDIVGTDEDSTELMKIALSHAQKRVVLKWPLRAEPMADIRPASHQILGKSTRYDVFMISP